MTSLVSEKNTFVSGYWEETEDKRGIVIPFPKFGDRLRNGAKVIAYKHVNNGERNWYPNGTVLANKRHGIGEWVVWTAIYDFRSDEWLCENGHYYSDIHEAASFFMGR